MAVRLTHREKMLDLGGSPPKAVQVVSTYASGPGLAVGRLALDDETGRTLAGVSALLDGAAAILVQQPNCLGVVEDLAALAEAAHEAGALLVVSVNPSVLGVLEAPGVLGADIAVGDAQVFGCAPSFGGPSAGFLACKEAYLRQIPGRLVGQTLDADGRICYALTLQAREQHIRRAKATSNICSNQALSALAATIHLALLGPRGLRERGELCLARAHYLHRALCSLPGVRPYVSASVLSRVRAGASLPRRGLRRGHAGEGYRPGCAAGTMERGALALCPRGKRRAAERGAPHSTPAENVLIVAVTEVNPSEALDRYAETAAQVIAETAPRHGEPTPRWAPMTGEAEPLIFEKGLPGHRGYDLPPAGVPPAAIVRPTARRPAARARRPGFPR